jgi:hypothetical protein
MFSRRGCALAPPTRSFISGLNDNQESETLIHMLVQLGNAFSIEAPQELSLLQAEQ